MKGVEMYKKSTLIALADRARAGMRAGVVRAVTRVTMGMAAGMAALLPVDGFAQSTTTAPGWGQAITNAGELFDNIQVAGLIFCTLVGVIAFITCGFLIWKKSKPEHSRDVQMSHIVWSAIAGTFFLAMSLIITNSVTTIGGSSSNIGQRTVYNGTNTN